VRRQHQEGEGATATPNCGTGGKGAHRKKPAVLLVTAKTTVGEALRWWGGGYLHGQRRGEVQLGGGKAKKEESGRGAELVGVTKAERRGSPTVVKKIEGERGRGTLIEQCRGGLEEGRQWSGMRDGRQRRFDAQRCGASRQGSKGD
jgi:hypothetical protein